VDDGSTDGTADSVRAWLTGHGSPEGWSLIEAEHRGAGHARDTGLGTLGDCGLVAFLDSDDLWPTDSLSRAERAFDQDPALVGVSADRLNHDYAANTRKRDDVAGLARDPLEWMLLHGAGFGSCSVVRDRGVRETGGYPTEDPTGHDIVLFTRLFALGRWGHLPGTPVTFRRNHAAAYREQDHIHRSVRDANARWTRLMETAFGKLERADTPHGEVRKAMARRWISVAKDCYKRGDRAEGVRCLRRSREHCRWSLRRVRWRARFAIMGHRSTEQTTVPGSVS